MMKQKKLWTAAVLAAAVLVSAAGCSGEKTGGTVQDSKAAGESSASGTAAEGAGTVKIATKPMTEQYILGEMLSALIQQETDYSVEITKGIGGGASRMRSCSVSGTANLSNSASRSPPATPTGSGRTERLAPISFWAATSTTSRSGSMTT